MITGSAVALHCCKAHSEINRKMENSTPCKIVTPENFILKLGTHDYVDKVTYYTIFDVDRFSGGFSPNRWNITFFAFFLSCPVLSFFFFFTRPARTARSIFTLYGSNDVLLPKDGPFWGQDDEWHFWGKCAPKTPEKPKSQNTKTCILSKLLHRFKPNFAQW